MHYRWKGVEDHTIDSPSYFEKVFYFHSAPVVKMAYHFVSYRRSSSCSVKYVHAFIGDLYMVSTRL
jgi:hypothetical protein